MSFNSSSSRHRVLVVYIYSLPATGAGTMQGPRRGRGRRKGGGLFVEKINLVAHFSRNEKYFNSRLKLVDLAGKYLSLTE